MSTIEIERRFLLNNTQWRRFASTPQVLKQGYLSVEKERTIRIRIIADKAWLTLKGYISDISRSEFEYPIPLSDAHTMLDTMCPFVVEKNRYIVHYQNFTFEIDEFHGDNAPLVLAELELPNEHTPYPTPNWLGREITSDERFTNAYLSKHPYSTWSDANIL